MFKTMCSSTFRKRFRIALGGIWVSLLFGLGILTLVIAINAGTLATISPLADLTRVGIVIGLAAGVLFLLLLAIQLIVFFRRPSPRPWRLHKTETRLLNAYYFQGSILAVFVASLAYLILGRAISTVFFPMDALSHYRYLNNHFLGNLSGLLASLLVFLVFHLKCPYLKPDAKKKGVFSILVCFSFLLFTDSLIPTIGDRIIIWATNFNYQIILLSGSLFVTWLIIYVSLILLEVPVLFVVMGIVPLSRKEQAAFGEKLKDLRSQFGMSQVELANLLFISPSLISKYENGKNLPGKDTLDRIAKIFDVPIEALDSELEDKAVGDKPEEGNFEP